MRSVVTFCLVLALASCAHASTDRAGPGSPRPAVTVKGLGIACTLRTDHAPFSYPASAVGNPGVPKLFPRDAAMLRAIRRSVHSRTLRFAYLFSGEFIVYDANAGPCEPGAPGYAVLNETCNTMYSPTDNFDYTAPVPECWNVPPRPWLKLPPTTKSILSHCKGGLCSR